MKLSYIGGLYGSGSPNYLEGAQEITGWGDYLFVSALANGRSIDRYIAWWYHV